MVVGIGLVLLLSVSAYGQENVQYQGTPIPLCDYNRNLKVSLPNWGCQRFISCDSDGLAFGPQDCGQGTLFDFEKQYCDFPGNFVCPENNATCATQAVQGDCTNFTLCVNGQEFSFSCGEDTMYSNRLHICEYPGNLGDEEKDYCRL
ncbi:uncharacterized protein LOC124136992 [Haliotis rufescens]|uniref:uncharacterized protein LOC124136992 n=1 Tax=Haliotis rufescens TaxID=6454 RepID=UPI00201EC3A0|nr:uncharacterized protein LOC124136992 [Haliotis rufescens]